ncbi:MAG: response regulator transcription factor [Anaerolineae bacterium]|nr:response regulator transcription factor [Anaerolineae bacterium]NUQ06960.1 response regulator transcription factor [Anaerolineae bacterium]
MQTILIVDDSRETVRALRVFLEESGFRVLGAYDGESALVYLRVDSPDLVILDLMLPDSNGLDITRSVRSTPRLKNIPIIMLTARIDDSDKIVGLEVGADDYITKPYNPREVVARVRSVLRRAQGDLEAETERALRYGDLTLYPSRHQLFLGDREVDLTRIEFEIMHALMRSPEHVFTRSELIETALNFQYEGLERSLDTHIKNLRKKIEPDPRTPDYIQTIYGVGYRLGSR